jgi:rubrerythrin
VELRLPSGSGSEIKLQRDLKQAIREYAPGSEIVADKRIWRSDGISFYSDAVRTREYRICKVCNHLQISKEVGMHLDQNQDGSCPICRNIPKLKEKEIVEIHHTRWFLGG